MKHPFTSQWIALVAVHDDILRFAGGIFGGEPLFTRRETSAAAAPELGLLNLGQYLFRRHSRKDFG